jgi:hypothetical protein
MRHDREGKLINSGSGELGRVNLVAFVNTEHGRGTAWLCGVEAETLAAIAALALWGDAGLDFRFLAFGEFVKLQDSDSTAPTRFSTTPLPRNACRCKPASNRNRHRIETEENVHLTAMRTDPNTSRRHRPLAGGFLEFSPRAPVYIRVIR